MSSGTKAAKQWMPPHTFAYIWLLYSEEAMRHTEWLIMLIYKDNCMIFKLALPHTPAILLGMVFLIKHKEKYPHNYTVMN